MFVCRESCSCVGQGNSDFKPLLPYGTPPQGKGFRSKPRGSAANPAPSVMICISLDSIGTAERGSCCLGSPRSPYAIAQACAIEKSLQSCHMTRAQHGRRKLLAISPCSTDVESDASFRLRRWEGSPQFHRLPTESLELGGPQSLRCCPAMVCLVLNLYRSTKRSKTQTLRIASWNVRTICPGLTDDLQAIQDAHKTAVIDRKLYRLNIDIAALQESRLSANGPLKEENYIFIWQGKRTKKTSERRVGFAIRKTLLRMIEPKTDGTERIVTLRLLTVEEPFDKNV